VLGYSNVKELIELVATTQNDRLDCDGCFARIAEFAEAHLAGHSLSAALASVQTHLESRRCCQYEYEVLRAAIGALEEKAGLLQ
jgi:hypothetical protein